MPTVHSTDFIFASNFAKDTFQFLCFFGFVRMELTSDDFLPSSKYVAVISSYFILLRDS